MEDYNDRNGTCDNAVFSAPKRKINRKVRKQRETARDRLHEWNNYYSNETFGIWIECTKCDKWRKVMEYQEDHQVPKEWCCSMNLSGISNCDEPENLADASFSPTKFIPGSIVWARIVGYPWWPGMIEDDPDTEEYYWIAKNKVTYYNVTFLDEIVSHAWVPASSVCSFVDAPPRIYQNRSTSKYSVSIEAAKIKATKALTMSIKERLQNYSFAHQFHGKWGPALNSDYSKDTNDIIQMLISEVNDIESIKSSDSDYNSVDCLEMKKCKIHTDLNLHENASKVYKVNDATCKNQTLENRLKAKKCPEMKIKNDDVKCSDISVYNVKTETSEIETISDIPASLQKKRKVQHTHLKPNKDIYLKEKKGMTNSTESRNEENVHTNNSKIITSNTAVKISKPNNKITSRRSNIEEKMDTVNTKRNKEKMPNIKRKLDEIKECHDKVMPKLKKMGKSEFKPPMKNNIKSNSTENNGNSKTLPSKQIAENRNQHTLNEENLMNKELFKENLEQNKSSNRRSNIKYSASKKAAIKTTEDTENNKTIKQNKKNEKNSKKDILDVLQKNLKGTSQIISNLRPEKESYLNSSESILHTNKNNECHNEEIINNNSEDLLDSQTEYENTPHQKSKTNLLQKRNIKNDKKAYSSTKDLCISEFPIYKDESSNAINIPVKQKNMMKTVNKIKGNLKKGINRNTIEEENKIETKDTLNDDIHEKMTLRKDFNKKNFSFSLDLNTQQSKDEDSDPFEAE